MVTRASRPPGFDMTYRPRESVYPVPLLERVPSFVYLAAAIVTVVLVVLGENSAPSSWLYDYVVVQDRSRLLGSRAFAAVLCIGAVASVLRGSMRGVRVFGDGVEAREITQLFVPKVRRYRWPQMALIVLDQRHVAVELWDGQRAVLPAVGDREGLVATLERVAAARDIPVQGGRGLDEIPEPPAPEEQGS
ncbi:MAG TPA: hypothetical protein VNN80_11860 [Polyangiaceae bacterium]|nr:hypothetical protein [Polyangiaceae bacterium]